MPTGHLCSDAVLTILTTLPASFFHEWNQHLPHCPNQKVWSHPPSTHTPWHCSPPIFKLWVLWILLPQSLYPLPPPQVGPPSILGYFHSHSRWPCLPVRPHPSLQWKHRVLPLSLANCCSSFRFPITSSRKTTKPDLGALATCFLSKHLPHDTVISYLMSGSLCRPCVCGSLF